MIREDVVKEAITNTIYSDKHKMEAISLIKSEACKARIAESLIEDENKLEIVKLIKSVEAKVKIIMTLKKDENKIEAIKNGGYSNKYINEIRKTIKDTKFIIDNLEIFLEEECRI